MKRSSFLFISGLFLATVLISCSSSNNASPGTSSLSFSAALKGVPGAPSLAPVTCGGTTGIATVEALLYDKSGAIVKTGGPWPCSDHQGTISGITASSQNYSMKLVLLTRDSSGYIKYSGDTGNTLSITTAGTNVDAGTVILTPFMAWSINTINGTGSVGRHSSVATDPTGTISMVYSDATNSALRYVTNRTGVWADAVVDSGNVGQFPAMVLDGSNKVRVSYYDQGNKDLKLASNATGTWIITTVDNSSNDVGQESSLAVDLVGKLHISYYDATAKTLKYATNAAGAWVVSTVDAAPDTGKYSSIAATTASNVHIAYYDVTNGNLNYAKWDGVSWTILAADSTGDVGQYPSLALDAGGNVHISYYDASTSNGSLKYLMITPAGATTSASIDAGASFVYEVPQNNYYHNISYGKRTSLKIDASGAVHIGYAGIDARYYSSNNYSTNFLQKYATNASGTWLTYTVEVVASGGYNSSTADIGRGMLSVDSSRNVHLSYWDLIGNRLKYATNAASAWSTYTLDMLGNVGQYTSIAANSTGKASISYYDATNGDLKFATNASGAWVTSAVDSTGTVGQYSSLALTGAGSARIAYFDDSTGHLKFATNAVGSWTTSTIDGSANVGKYASLALDASGNAHISYYDFDASTQNLKYATNASGSWILTAVEQLTDLGYHTSLAVDSANKQHISYSTADGKLRYATNAAGSWTASTVDSGTTTTQNQFQSTSIKTDSTGKIYISYYDAINGDLKFATRPTGTTVWSVSVIDSAGAVGQYSSLALDSNKKAHVSYYDVDRKVLRYATNYSGSWLTYMLDNQGTGGDVGRYSSIFIDAANKIHISYYDAVNGRLKYATTGVGSGGVLSDQGVPSTPTGLTAVDTAIDTITLSWTASTDYSGVAGYRIYRDGVYLATATSAGYADTGLGPGADYCYTIIAFDANSNESAPSQSACTVIPIDPNPVYALSIKVDTGNKIHIAYRRSTDDSIHYTSNSLGSWTTTTVANVTNMSAGPVLALDAASHAHVVYSTSISSFPTNTAYVLYTTNAAGSWAAGSIVDQAPAYSASPLNIQIGPGSVPHLAYALSSGSVKYAMYTGSTWTAQAVGAASGNVPGLGFAVDGSGYSHLAYRASNNASTIYATNSSGTWTSTTADTDNGVESLVFDSFGKVHIAYSQYGSSYDLVYLTNASGSWVATTLATGTYFDAQMAIGPGNILHIVYYDGADGSIRYATNGTGAWTTKYVIKGGYPVSIAVDSTNTAYVAYTSDGVNQGLYFMQVR